MKILHVIPTYLPAYRYGGTIFCVHGLCRALARSGHDVHVYTTNVNGSGQSNVPLAEPTRIDGVKVWYFGAGRGRRLYMSPTLTSALLERIADFAVVHIHSVFLWPTKAAVQQSVRAGVPSILSPHGMLAKRLIAEKNRFVKRLWISLIEGRNIRNVSALHVATAAEEREIQRLHLRYKRAFTIPFGFDPVGDCGRHETSGLEVPSTGKSYILSLGRINWKKRIENLISVLPLVPRIHLVIAGNCDDEGYLLMLRRVAADLGVDDRISWCGEVYGRPKEILFRRAEAFILCSEFENFGNAALEAMAYGCPAIVSANVGLADDLRASHSGLVVGPTSRELAAALNRLLADPELKRRIVLNAKARVDSHYRWDSVVARMTDAYRQVESLPPAANMKE